MKRREFIALLGGAAAASALPPGALAQPKVIRRVGFLGGVGLITPQSENYRAFLSQMDDLGFRAGRNVGFVEWRPANRRRSGGIREHVFQTISRREFTRGL